MDENITTFSNDQNDASKHSWNKIFYGVPGTGKSHIVKERTDRQEVIRTTFHPDTDYSTFVGCYKPTMKSKEPIYDLEQLKEKLLKIKNSESPCDYLKFGTKYWESLKKLSNNDIKDLSTACGIKDMSDEISKGIAIGQEFLNYAEDGKIVYSFTPQAFIKAYVKAWKFYAIAANEGKKPEKQYLIIEEINRGNCAQIFGDLFQLLDRDDTGFSKYHITPDEDIKKYLETVFNIKNFDTKKMVYLNAPDIYGTNYSGETAVKIRNGEILALPPNLYIWATMNTSDQSLFPMDSAFKRRWEWECVPIDYNNPDSAKFTITIGDKNYNWHEFLKAVNEKIVKATDSEDKQMGNFFVNSNVSERQFVDKVMFYLWNDICKEEFHTNNNLFRYYSDNGKTDTAEFSFNDLFGSNSTHLLQKFMDFIGVTPENAAEETANNSEER